MGAVNTTYTFTATDTITSTKMNNIIDQTVMTADALLDGSGGSGGLSIADGKLTISSGAINSSRLASGSVSNTNVSNTAAIAGTKISPDFGSQNITTTGNISSGNKITAAKGITINSTNNPVVQLVSNTGNAQESCIVNNWASGANTGVLVGTSEAAGYALQVSSAIPTSSGLPTGAGTPRMVVTAAGDVGIGLSAPSSKLGILSNTSNATPEGGAHGIAIQAGDGGKEINMGYDSSVDIGYINASKAGSLRPIVLQSRGGLVGIGKTNPSTILDVNGTVTATAFAGPLTGDVTGNVTGTASTVSNGAITAAKLDGAQSGSAPIYGCRAWVNFDGTRDSSGATNASNTNRFIRSSGNVTSVKKDSTGRYTITFTTPFPAGNTNYTVVCSAGNANSPRVASADRATATESSIQIETDDTASAVETCTENSVMVIG